MPSSRSAKLVSKIGPLRQIPVLRLLAAAEILVLARDHLMMLEPQERRRVVELIRRGHGRRRNLTLAEREDLATLIAKAHPRLFAGLVVEKLSPVRLPSRLVRGKQP